MMEVSPAVEIASMPYRGGARQTRQDGRQKNFLDQAHAFFEVQRRAIGRNDAGRLLAAVLECVEAKVGELGRFGVTENSRNAAMIVEMVVVDVVALDAVALDGVGWNHR